MPEDPRPTDERKRLVIEREYHPDDDAIRRAFAILLRQSGERKDVAA